MLAEGFRNCSAAKRSLMEVVFKFSPAALCSFSPQNVQCLMKHFLFHPAPKGRLIRLAMHLSMYTNRIGRRDEKGACPV